MMTGDLNYRLRGEPEDCLREVAEAAVATVDNNLHQSELVTTEEEISKCSSNQSIQRENSQMFNDEEAGSWVQRRYSRLMNDERPKRSGGEWHRLLARDELNAAKAEGVILAHFREGIIAWPPSYR